MAVINKKITIMQDALRTLDEAIKLYDAFKNKIEIESVTQDRLIALATRDSVIQRFEYCTDLFWKVMKIYLEDVQRMTLSVTGSPTGIIRSAVQAKIISEEQGEQCIEMIKSRNLTSHIYHEEVADDIAVKIPDFYQLMKTIVDKIAMA